MKFWFYVVVLLLLAVLGLAVGSANGSIVSFNLLFIKVDVTVATVLVIGIAFGFFLGIYACLLLCFKLWRQSSKAKTALNKYKKAEASRLEAERIK